MGLNSVQKIHDALGKPADGLPAVHIAGTNGKGSVALKMARSLQLGGVKTGLFVSPHVSCFRERMLVNGKMITEHEVEDILPQIFDLCESHNIPATFFEINTAMAFKHFRNSGVDAIVVEAGLGGRLDSTNIITPALSIITSIGLDHMNVLGDTLEEIALDKAGIFKPGVPALIGKSCPVELLKSVADSRGCPFHVFRDDGPGGAPSEDFDEENSRLAETALKLLGRTNPALAVDEEALRKGVTERPQCRFQVVEIEDDASTTTQGLGDGVSSKNGNVSVVMDVGHNPAAITRLFDKLRKEFPNRRFRVVTAFSSDKDSTTCLEVILKNTGPDRIHLAEAATQRSTPPGDLASILEELSGGDFDSSRRVLTGEGSVRQAVRDAIREAMASGTETSEKDVLVVCGTVYMMADVRKELGFDEPRDSDVVAEVAGSHFRSAQDNFDHSGSKP
eukprot:jgi/Undpi1/185/HiC_scaffold_1.g00182.m1